MCVPCVCLHLVTRARTNLLSLATTMWLLCVCVCVCVCAVVAVMAVSEHLGAQHSALDMLYQRINIIRSYLKAVKAGWCAPNITNLESKRALFCALNHHGSATCVHINLRAATNKLRTSIGATV